VTTFTLTLTPVSTGPPPELRIRRLLKTALRRHRLRWLSFIAAEKPHQMAQDATAGMRMSHQSVQSHSAPERRKNSSNRPSGQQRTAVPKGVNNHERVTVTNGV